MNASKCLASRSCFYNIYLYFFLNAVLALILLCTVRHLCHRTCDVTRVESPLGDILAVLAAQQICSVSCFWGLILPLKNRPKKLFVFLFFVNCIFCIYSFNFLKKHSLHRHFKAFHWLRNNESHSVVSAALLCVSLPLRQRKVILCCYETTFLTIAELTYSLTYQMIISSIPSIRDFVYIHFAQTILRTVDACLQ